MIDVLRDLAVTAAGRAAARMLLLVTIVVAIFFVSSAVAQSDDGVDLGRFELYGFLRLDAIYDDSRMQNPQYAMWVLSEDPRAGTANDAHYTIHPRVSRIGVRLVPSPLTASISARGVLEVDFQNGGSESREMLRMRLAYFELRWRALYFLGGQSWDIISPLYPNAHTDGIMWNAGNLGDRHPQLRLTLAPQVWRGAIVAAVSSGLAGAVDNKDLDGDGRLDGQDSGLPFVQARLGFDQSLWPGQSVALGAWGHYAREEMAHEDGSKGACEAWVAGIDALVVLWRFELKGEAWVGSNASDVRGGIGQGVNPLTMQEVGSRGGWAQLGIRWSKRLSSYAGVSVDNPNDGDVPSYEAVTAAGLPGAVTGRTQNRVLYQSNNLELGGRFNIGVEYFYWVTEYRGLESGDNNRLNVHFSLFF